ncbi:bifunctional Aminoacyl-tRNA synthetase [Babesia duncani]|uniref:aspartate--tRNA ligase n=1 Tax=Babesia duncani TaxID=323732 RepID=A0AAD9UNQ0_9APIC|nr:bifunctional Aminoacyl-tRNA synthetase [Babesia duncani]
MALLKSAQDIQKDSYGYITSETKIDCKRDFARIAQLKSGTVWLRTRVNEVRGKGAICFLVLRQQLDTVQAIIDSKSDACSKDMVKWASSIVDVYAKVVVPDVEITSTTSKASTLPFLIRDANNTDNEIISQKPETNMSICAFRVQSQVCQLFREFLHARGFTEIHTPKLLGGTSEGGANVFKLKYFDEDACLAQSPQLYKQMAICGDMGRVFEIGNFSLQSAKCRACLDLEMEFMDSYLEVVDLVDDLLKSIFVGLEDRCKDELAHINGTNPSITPFKWLEETPRFSFKQAVDLLRPHQEIPEDLNDFDFNTEQEKLLGSIVKQKYNTDYYIVYGYPRNVRPFYTAPGEMDGTLKTSESYDFFMRGEEILSGAHRIHDADMLHARAVECGIDPQTISEYIEAFRYGVPPHGGCGIGLERVVMLFLGLGNVRKTCMFPRDPKRLSP